MSRALSERLAWLLELAPPLPSEPEEPPPPPAPSPPPSAPRVSLPVACPALGEITSTTCIDTQDAGRVKACRGCVVGRSVVGLDP